MTPEQFCYWLQGFGELTPEPPTPEQWQAIKEHLTTVFRKVTPPAPGLLGFANPMREGLGGSVQAAAQQACVSC